MSSSGVSNSPGSIEWEITEDDSRRTIYQGKRDLKQGDIEVIPASEQVHREPRPPAWTPAAATYSMFDFYWKQIYLEGGFLFSLVSKPVSAPEDLRGFLMRVQRTSVESISMEWFDVDRDDHARKAQEGGELGIRIARGARGWEVVYTAFLTDISLRIMTRGGGCLFGPFASAPRPLWRIRILKGSHITWPVVGEGRVATPPN